VTDGVGVTPVKGKYPWSLTDNASKKAHEKLFSSNQIFFVCPGSIRTWFSKILSSHFL
jgi:hypothetical protein